MEGKMHRQSAFITLTYADEFLPPGGHLNVKHLQKFLKRLRKYITPRTIRHLSVGEYGTEKGRPHYHVILFGIGSEELISILPQLWKLGSSEPNRFKPFGDLTDKNARYIARYCTKKIHSKQLNGRPKEFQIQSRLPAIGDQFIRQVARIWRGSGLVPDHILKKVPSSLSEYISGIRGTYTKFQTNTIRINGKKYLTSPRFNQIILDELGAEPKIIEFERELANYRMDAEPLTIEDCKESEILANRQLSRVKHSL